MYSEKIDANTIRISELVGVPSRELEEMSRRKVMEFYTPRNFRKRLNGVSQWAKTHRALSTDGKIASLAGIGGPP